MSINAVALLNSKVVQSDDEDNATATASAAAITAQSHGALGIHADYSATVSAVKTVTLKRATTTLAVFRHDFTAGAFIFPLPSAVWGGQGEVLSVELEASGTGGTSGRATLFFFTR